MGFLPCWNCWNENVDKIEVTADTNENISGII